MSNSPGADKLKGMIGFDPAKKETLTQSLFEELVAEAREERLKKAKEVARDKLRKAMELREQMHALEKKFNSECQKFEKELGKLLNEIENGLNNRGGQQAAPESSESPEDSQ